MVLLVLKRTGDGAEAAQGYDHRLHGHFTLRVAGVLVNLKCNNVVANKIVDGLL